VSAKGVFGIAKRRFPLEFPQQFAMLPARVFEIGLLERLGVVTSLCCLEPRLIEEERRMDLALKSGLLMGLVLRNGASRTAAACRKIGGLEISGTSAGLRGNFLDDSW
jgi:hypothetical protein